jgi:TolB-like protein
VLQQLKVTDGTLLDPATPQQIGTQTNCDFLLVSSLSDRGQTVVINLRLVDTATGQAMMANRTEAAKITARQ